MGNLVAIGGGEIGKPGNEPETTGIDLEIIRLSGKKKPRLLFIPTASGDSAEYVRNIREHFGDRLGCIVDTLFLFGYRTDAKMIENMIMSSDIIYTGGGNTLRMMKAWRRLGVDILLKKALDSGIVLSGMSAGAICLFRYGCSDSRRNYAPDADLIRVRGIGMVNALFCPHFSGQADRRPFLREIMKRTPGPAIAVDDCCALEMSDGRYRVLSTKEDAKAYRVFWKSGQYHEELIKKHSGFDDLKDLLNTGEAII